MFARSNSIYHALHGEFFIHFFGVTVSIRDAGCGALGVVGFGIFG